LAVMVNVWIGLVSLPPPLSLATRVTVAVPFAFGASAYVSVPVAPSTAGRAVKNLASVLKKVLQYVMHCTANDTAWPASSVACCAGGGTGYGRIAVAQAGTDCAPASSSTDTFAPLAKLGGSFT